MQVPLGPDRSSAKSEQHPFVEPSGPPLNPYYTPSSQLQRPPRLPLPIGEEVFSPGSPIIGPTDLNNDAELNFDDLESTIPRKSSTLSSTTADDDELGDELQPYEVDGVVKTVPTLIEWKQSGEKVYVTGTFAGWNRKFRLHKRYVPGFSLSPSPPSLQNLQVSRCQVTFDIRASNPPV